jgi:hypothetical protein
MHLPTMRRGTPLPEVIGRLLSGRPGGAPAALAYNDQRIFEPLYDP